jgi:hypothetical protein
LPDAELSATPKLLPGVVTHPCTREVTSMTMNCSATAGVNEATVDPSVGIVANVTVDSFHVPVTGCTFTRPEVLIRFT